MKQKRINDYLYVYSLEPYIITNDTDAELIFVQEELFDDYKKLNPSLTQLAKKNYDILTVVTPEWNLYRDESDEIEIPLNDQMENIPDVNIDGGTITTNTNVTGFSLLKRTAYTTTCNSTNTNVATVDNSGMVGVKGAGTTDINVNVQETDEHDEYNKSWVIVVEEAETSKIDPNISIGSSYSFFYNEDVQLQPTNPYGLDLIYSSDSEYISINEYGFVTATSEATIGNTYPVYVTFAGNNDFKAQQVMTIIEVKAARQEANISWKKDGEVVYTFEAALGEESTLPVLDNPNSLVVTYASDSADVNIDQNGNVTFVNTTNQATISASYAGSDNYKPAMVAYNLKVIATSKGYAFMTETPTAENIALSLKLNVAKPTVTELVDMTDLSMPTDMYLVCPKSWEVYDSVNDIIIKPVITDTRNGGEMGIWYETADPYITVEGIDYRIFSIQLGKGTFNIEF